MSRRVTGIATVLSLLVIAVTLAADGELRWHSEIRGEAELYRGVWTATTTRKLVVVGGSGYSAPRVSRFSVWAVDQRRGELQWERHLRPPDTGSDWNHAVQGVAAKGKVVVAAGTTNSAEGGDAFSVAALDARDGAVLWQDALDAEGSQPDHAQAVAIQGRTVVVVGRSVTDAGGWAFLVRAYDLRTGDLSWEDRYEREADRPDIALDVAVLGKRAFVVGRTSTEATTDSATIRAYDVRSGMLLWEDHADHFGNESDGFGRVTATRGRVFATGSSNSRDGAFVAVTRAYRAKDGALLWEDVYETGRADPKFLAADRALVAVALRTVDDGPGAFSVHALNAKTGEPLWTYRLERPSNATGRDTDSAQFVAVGKKGVYAAGVHGSPMFDRAMLVVALSRKDGREIWRDIHDTDDRESAWCGAKTKSRLFVSGDSESPEGDFVIPIRAYKAK